MTPATNLRVVVEALPAIASAVPIMALDTIASTLVGGKASASSTIEHAQHSLATISTLLVDGLGTFSGFVVQFAEDLMPPLSAVVP